MFSKLIFGYGKLIMRIYFAQIVIHIKIDFDFFIPFRVRIDHSVSSDIIKGHLQMVLRISGVF